MDAEKKAEPKKKYPPERKSPPGTGEQYLLALIKCADWVSEPYKQLAEKHRTNTEFIKELYLCACEGIPIERAVEVQGASNPQMALEAVRHSCMETCTDEYKEEMSGIKGMTAVLEKEVRQMSGVLQHIVDYVPCFDAMFPAEEQRAESVNSAEEAVQEQPAMAKQEEQKMAAGIENGPKGRWCFRIKKRKTADFVEKLLESGYTREQLEYILDCMEEGLEIGEIQRFSSPKLPVDVMRRLRSMEEKKESRGKRRK